MTVLTGLCTSCSAAVLEYLVQEAPLIYLERAIFTLKPHFALAKTKNKNKKPLLWSSRCGTVETNLTKNHEVVGS